MISAPREYQHLLRGPRYAWWRSLLTIAMSLGFSLLIMLLSFGALVLLGQRQALNQAFAQGAMTPLGFGVGNILLAILVPMTMLSTRIMHGVSAGFLSSVRGRIRWRWLLWCALIAVLLQLITNGLGLLVDGPQGAIPAQQALLLLLVLTTTPLQAAGEEYLSRGVIMQNIGALFPHPRVGLIVATIASTGLFAAAHGSADPWIFIDLASTGFACCILTWATGGLEAAVVLHAANNVVGMVVTILFGGWGEGFVDKNSVGKPQDALISLLVTGAIAVPILWRARRQGVQRVYQPAESVGGDAVGSRRMNVTLWIVILAPLAIAMAAGLVAAVVMLLPKTPRKLHYTEVAATIGITREGCLGGQLIAALPLEIRRYRTRELVADDTYIEIGERHITGQGGVFQFPIAGELMTNNPAVQVVQADRKSIAYRFRFLDASVPSLGKCPVTSGARP